MINYSSEKDAILNNTEMCNYPLWVSQRDDAYMKLFANRILQRSIPQTMEAKQDVSHIPLTSVFLPNVDLLELVLGQTGLKQPAVLPVTIIRKDNVNDFSISQYVVSVHCYSSHYQGSWRKRWSAIFWA